MKSPLQIKVLGELVVLRDAREIVLPPSKKTRALLAYLAVVNRRQRRDQLFTETFIPGASREQMAWFNDLQKETASPVNASLLHYAFGDTDVSAILGEVSVPTLVLHARKDAAVPFEEGKVLAAGIPGARFVDLNSANHILLSDEPAFADFVHEVRSFLSVTRAK